MWLMLQGWLARSSRERGSCTHTPPSPPSPPRIHLQYPHGARKLPPPTQPSLGEDQPHTSTPPAACTILSQCWAGERRYRSFWQKSVRVRGRGQQEPKHSCSVLKQPHSTALEGTDGATLVQQGRGEVLVAPHQVQRKCY